MSALLQDYLTRAAERDPEKVAVVMGDERLSYGELELQSNRLARLLLEHGCRGGDRVCLLLPKSPAAIAAMIAVLKAGAAYVPIDVSSPAPRVQSILSACEPRVVLACAKTAGLARELALGNSSSARLGLLDGGGAGEDEIGAELLKPAFGPTDWAAASADPLSSGGSSEDLAHILFTSGSTGVPKGVTIAHANVISFVEWAVAHFGISAEDRLSGHPPLHFDLSTFDIYGTLLVGAELHLVPASSSQPETLIELIRDSELTQWFSVPSALTFMIKYGTVHQGDFPHLKRLIWCGEVIPTPTLIEWMRRLPHVEFTNLYGPTEATIASSWFTAEEIPADATAPIPIGVPCAGEELVVLDDELAPLPAGETGEIYIGGVGLSPGYWRDTEKTAAAFRLREEPSGEQRRWYRTGDLGYVGQDGLFYILGRVDSQIKSRGYRIELGEVEAALNALPVLQECAVVGVQVGGFLGTAICCAYSPLDPGGVSDVELRELLSLRLPTYMLPSYWLALDSLPKNLNGKIDRRELRERFERLAATAAGEESQPSLGGTAEEHRVSEESSAAPGGSGPASEHRQLVEGPLAELLEQRSPTEWDAVVLEVVRTEAAAILVHLTVQEIEPERAFGELGLDSLGAVELSGRLAEATGLELAATLIFDHPTPAEVASFLRAQVEGVERVVASTPSVAAYDEPIAIVGMSCRFPGGVRSPEDLWRFLLAEGDAIGEFPSDRGWDLETLYDPDPDGVGTSYTRHGGFVHDAVEFDAGFFSIAPREARTMDPQQRLFLEGAWEALEDAGIDPSSLRGSPTGVFAGVVSVFTPDERRFTGSDEGMWMTGSCSSVISGRVSYFLGLEGPAISVDTASSSSLVALHQACQALRSGECTLALAGGVTVLATPGAFVYFSRQRGLSLDGRCKSFGAEADGTGWAEGVGIVLLERLSDAQRNGHRVLGLVRASATNQDGASNGLTAPNGSSQERVIRQALTNAGLSTSEVDAVEAHGTGTVLGDPIEARALLGTYGQDRGGERPLYLGSVKSNIGHTHAAAGIAGIIKMVQALRYGVLPKTLHAETPSRHVDWSEGEVELLSEAQPWPARERPRRAGVSAFGVSGTNVHVILEEAPAQDAAAEQDPAAGQAQLAEVSPPLPAEAVLPWIVSGKGVPALRAQAERLGQHLVGALESSVGDVGLSLAVSRAALRDRAVVLGAGREQLLEGLAALARGEPAAGVHQGVAGAGEERLALLFTGQGAQRVGMGAELYGAFPVFAGVFDEACAYLDGYLDRSLREVVLGEGESVDGSEELGPLDDTAFTQAGLFALEVALFRLVESWGVKPDFVMGHSIGELAAAHVAGVFSLPDACRLVAARGRLMSGLPAGGAMVAVGASEEEVLQSLQGYEDRVSVAGVNGPSSVVLAGAEQDVLEVAGVWKEQGRQTKRLRVSHAFHSPLMDGILDEFRQVAEGISFEVPVIPLVSNVTGEVVADEVCAADYWVRHVRATVRFGAGVRCLADRGVRSFLELGPDGVLSGLVGECLGDGAWVQNGDGPSGEGSESAAGRTVVAAVAALRAERPEVAALLSALARLWVGGCTVDWARMFDGSGSKRVQLPTYAFQRERFWLEQRASGDGDAAAIGLTAAGHPLLGAAVAMAESDGRLFAGRLSLRDHPWLADHVVMGSVLLPGTAFLELALHVGEQVGVEYVQELTLRVPLLLDERREVQLQVALAEADEAGCRAFGVYSRAGGTALDGTAGQAQWVHHAEGVLAPPEPALAARHDTALLPVLGDWPPADAERVDLADAHERLLDWGLEYGPAFRGLQGMWRRDEEVFAEVALPGEERGRAGLFGLHPALLDAALHAVCLGLPGMAADGGALRLPFSWNEVALLSGGASALRVRVAAVGADGISLVAANERGRAVLSASSLLVREVSESQIAGAGRIEDDAVFRVDWVSPAAAPSAANAAGEEWTVLEEAGVGLAAALEEIALPLRCFDGLAALSEAVEQGMPAPAQVLVGCLAASGAAQAQASDRGAETPAAARAAAHRVLELVQAWLADERFSDCRLVVVSEGAVAVEAGDGVPGLAQAPVWGLLRSAQSEHPDRVVLVDVDGTEASWRMLAQALASGEPQLAIRAGQQRVPRLARMALRAKGTSEEEAAGGEPGPFDSQRTVLITGGTGGLGALLARHLVGVHGVSSVVLASRRGPAAEGARELEDELSALGARVTIAACDVSDREQVAALLQSMPAEHPLGTVVHAAGVLDDGVIGSLTEARLDGVLVPKVDAAWHLHELTAPLELSAFVLFSSVSATLGAAGQGNYAAANAFLDALAAHRRAHGLPGVSIAWGMWEQLGGMTAELSEASVARLEHAGMRVLTRERGLELLDALCAGTEAQVVASPLDLGALRAGARSQVPPAVLRGLVRVPQRRAAEAAGGSLAVRLARAPAGEHERIALEVVLAQVATVLGHASAEAIDPRQTFKDMGFDSLAAVDLRNRLNADTGTRLPATLIFDHPNPAAVAERLLEGLALPDPAAAVSVEAQLTQFERQLAEIVADDARRRSVTARLQDLLARLSIEEETLDDADVEHATADEVFALLDRELDAS
jgi:amino acid adenylation domain-containing protein